MCYTCPHRVVHVTLWTQPDVSTPTGDQRHGACIWMSLLKATWSVFGLYSLTQVQGWGSGGTRGLNPDSVSLAQPAERVQLEKGGFLRLMRKERW